MKEKKECKIIQDLLPNYIENLTNEETNQYIQEHLKECKECKKIQERMQKDIEINTEKRNKKEINYMKKYSRKMKTLKSIIGIIILIFVAITARKMIIIKTLQHKAEQYINSDNYYAKMYNYQGNDLAISERYQKGEKYITIQKNLREENVYNKMISYKDEDTSNIYIEYEEEKIALVDVELMPNFFINDFLYTENIFEFIVNSVCSSIKSAECNGKECYKIQEFYSSNFLYLEGGSTMYIEKGTGLPVRIESGVISTNNGTTNTLIDYQYKFNCVTDEDLKEPDVNEYKIQ